MATTRELLPCPFCGGDARLHKVCDECTTDIGFRCRHEISPNAVCKIGEKVFWVEHECDVVDTNGVPLSSPCFSSASEAIAAWNTLATIGSETCPFSQPTDITDGCAALERIAELEELESGVECEVVQGKNGPKCSNCGKELPEDPYSDYEGNFCPTCGARVRGDAE